MGLKSDYFHGLTAASKTRYETEVLASGLEVDPYSITTWVVNSEEFPEVNLSDMVMYMISTPSPYTREEIKAWKGILDGENFMKSGWIHSIKTHQFTIAPTDNENYVIMGEVKHSQRLSATPLFPWVIAAQKGEVLAAHCTCMAGLGEACSHIAAILSCLVRATELRHKSGLDSCTSQQCSWLPTARDVSPAKVNDIRFSQSRKCKQSDAVCTDVMPPLEQELDVFYEALNKANKKPAILRITKPYFKELLLCGGTAILPSTGG